MKTYRLKKNIVTKIKNDTSPDYNLFVFFVMTAILAAIPINLFAIKRVNSTYTEARESNNITNRYNQEITIAVEDNQKEKKIYGLKNFDLATIKGATQTGTYLQIQRTNGKEVLSPAKTIVTYRHKHLFNSSNELVVSESKNEKIKISFFNIKFNPLDNDKINIQGDAVRALGSNEVYINDLLKNDVGISAANYTQIFTNTDNRPKTNTFDIFFTGLCYEKDKTEYNRLVESLKNQILNGDYFKDNKYRINIYKLDDIFSSSYGCNNSGSTATAISNVVKPLGADTVIVLVNNSQRVSYGYFPTSYYLGTTWMSRPITELDLLLLHEMGHSIGQLSDEYVDISNPDLYANQDIGALSGISDFANCKAACSMFSSKYTNDLECSKGCGYSSSLFRTSRTSIMKNWKGVYNLISKDAIDYTLNSYASKNSTTQPLPPPTSEPGDRIKPVITIRSPVSLNVSKTISIDAAATDNIKVAKIELRMDSIFLKSCSNINTCQTNYDTTGLTDGNHNIIALAFDSSNNSASQNFTINVKNQTTSPQITDRGVIKEPVNGNVISLPFSFNWSSVENVKLYSIWIGTNLGKNDIYGTNVTNATVTNITASKLWKSVRPDQKIYVRLWTNFRDGRWLSSDTMYTIK